MISAALRVTIILLVALGAQAQLASPPSGAASAAPPTALSPGAAAEQKLTISLAAVAATTQGDKTDLANDSTLRPYRGLLEQLPYTHFEQVASHEVTASPGEETKIPINGIYTALVRPGAAQGELIDLAARIEMLHGDDYIDALRTTAQAAPGKPLLFRGLQAPHGELVVILRVAPESDGNQQNRGQDQQEPNEQQQEQQNQQKQEQQEQQESQPEEQQGEVQEPQPQEERDQSQEEDMDRQNIEAILQSLEEIDRKEQTRVQQVPGNVRVKGDWW